MYRRGEGVARNYKEAIKFYRVAAEKGSASAQSNLGAMYMMGLGGAPDYQEAIKWNQLSAEQGHAEAQSNLGALYQFGKGVGQNYIQAHKWFDIAGANGYEKSRKFRENIKKRMTPSQIAEAQKLAREWMNKHQKK